MIGSSKLMNLALRGLAIGIRFLFVFLIAKEISLELLGTYSLWTTTVSIVIMVIGMDYYSHSTRELLKRDRSGQWSLIRDQGIFTLLSYVIFLPLLFFVPYTGILDPSLIFFLLGVVVIEHLGTELYRLFNTLERPLFANFLLFVRSASWVLLLVGQWWLTHNPFDMKDILLFWLGGGLIGILIGVVALLIHFKGESLQRVDTNLMRQGLKASAWLLAGTLALKTIELSDRYMIDYFLGKEQLGVFSFYYQLSNVINVVIFTVIIALKYPSLYKAIYDVPEKVNSIRKSMLSQSMLAVVGLGALLLVGTPFLVRFMGRPLIGEYTHILPIMLCAVVFFNVYLIYKIFLNAWNMDVELFLVLIVAAIVNLSLNYWLIPNYGIIAASVASLIAYALAAAGVYVLGRSRMKSTLDGAV